MAFLSSADAAPRYAGAASDPFASLSAPPATPARSWFVGFLKTPFEDIDNRASYWLERKRQAAAEAAALRAGRPA